MHAAVLRVNPTMKQFIQVIRWWIPNVHALVWFNLVVFVDLFIHVRFFFAIVDEMSSMLLKCCP